MGNLFTWIGEREKFRLEVKEWIVILKKDGGFDYYFDFDKYLRDKNNQTNLVVGYAS